MQPPRAMLIAYEAMEICNPCSFDLVDRALRVATFPKGARTLELGGGNGAMSIHLAETFGCAVEAIEREPAMFAIAQARAQGRGAPGQVNLHNVDSKDYLGSVQPFDLLVSMGATRLAADSTEPQAVLGALAAHLRPGGFLLLGDLFWTRKPEPAIAATVADQMIGETHSAYIIAGEAAGLKCWYAAASPEQDWDEYAWRISAANEAWLVANPEDPDARVVRAYMDYLRGAYLARFRGLFGFGVYLFRKPGDEKLPAPY